MSKKLDEIFDGFNRINGAKLKEYLAEKLEQPEKKVEPKVEAKKVSKKLEPSGPPKKKAKVITEPKEE